MNKIIEDEKGSIFVESIIKLLIVCMIILFSLHAAAMFTQYQNLNYTAKGVAKIIEQEGAYNSNANDAFYEYQEEFHKKNKNMKLEVIAPYLDPTKRIIQFKDRFSVIVTDYYDFPIVEPLGAPKVSIKVPMRAKVEGMSEVYYKDDEI